MKPPSPAAAATYMNLKCSWLNGEGKFTTQKFKCTSSGSSSVTEVSKPSTNLLSLITDSLLLACLISSLDLGEAVLDGEEPA